MVRISSIVKSYYSVARSARRRSLRRRLPSCCCGGGAASAAAAAAVAAASSSSLPSSVAKPISLEELVSLAFHVCLELDVRKDVEAGQGCVGVCICDRSDARVGGPPVGAEDEEGFDHPPSSVVV
jgi:hypothetical protein